MNPTRELLDSLREMKGARFASFLYRNSHGELAKYRVLLGAKFTNVYEKDRDYLRERLDAFTGLDKEAAVAILNSIEESLAVGIGNNSAYVHGPLQGDTYLHFQGVPGVTFNKNDSCLHVKALIVDKTVIEEGTYKEVKSRPLTLAKQAIEANLRRGKIRQFKFTSLKVARLNGDVIEFE